MNQATVESLAANSPSWLADQRRTAWRTYESLPRPTPQKKVGRPLDSQADLVHKTGAGNGSPFVQASLSSLSSQLAPKGTFFGPMTAALAQHGDLVRQYLGQAIPATEPDRFAALHSALWSVGAFLYVPRNVKLPEPLEVTYRFEGQNVGGFPRTLVVIEPGAEATLVQRFEGDAEAGLFASGAEVFVGEGARLHYISLQKFAGNVRDFTFKRARIGRDAEIDWVLGMLGGSQLRYDVQCHMHGEGGMSYLYGVGVGDGRQQLTQVTRQHHQVGNTTSDLLFKNVLRDRAHSDYTGVIKVEKNANGTNAYQSNRNLVLDPGVQCDTRPVLEIESNKLRCTHGATVGRLDENQLYYLRTRGLTPTAARNLLIEAFLNPVLDRIRVESVRAELATLIQRKVVR